MQKKPITKTFGNGFDHMENEDTFRQFIAWWNERSHFPFEKMEQDDDDFAMAA